MYITSLKINTHKHDARRLLSNPQKMHIAVLSSFSVENINSVIDRKILWRLDVAPNNTKLQILSETIPDLTHLVDQTGWNFTRNYSIKEYYPILTQLQLDKVYSFTLTTTPDIDKLYTTSKDYLHWIESQSKNKYFQLVKSNTMETKIVQHQIISFTQEPETKIDILKITYKGYIKITHKEKFIEKITNNIGINQEYGCGLMTLENIITKNI